MKQRWKSALLDIHRGGGYISAAALSIRNGTTKRAAAMLLETLQACGYVEQTRFQPLVTYPKSFAITSAGSYFVSRPPIRISDNAATIIAKLIRSHAAMELLATHPMVLCEMRDKTDYLLSHGCDLAQLGCKKLNHFVYPHFEGILIPRKVEWVAARWDHPHNRAMSLLKTFTAQLPKLPGITTSLLLCVDSEERENAYKKAIAYKATHGSDEWNTIRLHRISTQYARWL